MALHGRPRGDITIHGFAGDDQFGLRWNRILFPTIGMPAVHFGPAAAGNEAPAPSGHAEPTLSAPIDSDSAPAVGAGEPAQSAIPQADAAAPAVVPAPAPEALWHPPYFAPSPDAPADPAPAHEDAAPPGGFIPRSEAIIWSGPAIMAFPGDAHDSASDAAAPDTTGTADIPDSTSGTDPGGAPDTAGSPDPVTRDDLDPILAAMGSGTDHAPSPEPGGDLSAAFLPPDSSDLVHPGHGLDPGFAFTPQPLPPPPDIIG